MSTNDKRYFPSLIEFNYYDKNVFDVIANESVTPKHNALQKLPISFQKLQNAQQFTFLQRYEILLSFTEQVTSE